MDRLQSMRVFRQVVDEGGFAAAARKLDLDPAAVTRLVGDLERHLGVRLLQRTTRRVSPTPEGEAYVARLRGILEDIDDAAASVREHTRAMGGKLRILAPPVLATHIVAPALAAFQRKHPEVHIDLRVANLADPAIEEYDLTLIPGTETVPPDAVAREITRSEAVLCATPGYLRAHGTPRQPEDLARHRLLRLRSASGLRLGPMRLLDPDSGAERLVDTPPVLAADHTDTLLRATLDGAGISSQPEDLVAADLAAGALRRVLAPWITNQLAVVAVYPSRKFLPLRTRAFLDHLVEHTRKARVQLRKAR